MKILNFDTSLEKTYITLSNDDNEIISEIIENQQGRYHSAFLLPTLAKILREANLQMKDLDYIATNIGPGSFTGIRAGLTVARTICQQTDVKALGVSSLEILSKINADKSKTLVALDARKNCAYLYVDNEIKGAVPLEEVKKLIEAGKYTVLTDDKLQPILGGQSYQQMNLPLGEILAELAETKSLTDECNWRLLKPLYIQPPPMG